jgi:mannose-6-phosphate isomerase-like protein (cupin superfamily)
MKVDYMVRNWGRWYVLDDLTTTKVKKLIVDPGCQLSYQKHLHRTEIWYVHQGNGVVILSHDGINEDQHILEKGTTLVIDKECWHQLINTGKEPLVIIEIQYGEECREHDIVRRPNPDYPDKVVGDDEEEKFTYEELFAIHTNKSGAF